MENWHVGLGFLIQLEKIKTKGRTGKNKVD